MIEQSTKALVIGAGGIGSAVAGHWLAADRFRTVWTVSRNPGDTGRPDAIHRVTDHSPQSIRAIIDEVMASPGQLSRIVITLGTLQGAGYAPEKSLESLEPGAMQAVHQVNCVLPMMWLAALAPGLRRNPDCRIAVLSARVGSITDNGLGGWYSYRSAKAALNMGLKCAAIELARRARGVKLIAFHPGTVDTALSRPFQRGVPEGKLFDAARVAGDLDRLMDRHAADGELSYIDWAGETIPW